jgi:putative copper resistance protein D
MLSETSQAIHLVSSGFWFGSLLPLIVVLGRIRDPGSALDVKVAIRRFSGLGHAAVALALASGVANTWLVLRHATLSLSSTYQLLLLIKVALAGTMCVLALVNRYMFVPTISAGDPGARRLREGTIAEIFIGAGVIALVSVLGLLAPD